MIFQNLYKNKKVFLTGHTGFKGTWLTIWLEMLGAKVKGYALKPETPSLFNYVKENLKIESVIADIRNKKKLEEELLAFQPDFVFHLAAQPLVRESYRIPVETFEVNVIGTANLLDAVRNLKKECMVVIVTTDKVYENIEKDYAYIEADKLGGYDPYSASKAAAEIITESYRLSFFNPKEFSKHKKSIATARAGNVIGGGDYAKDRIVPDIFRFLSKKQIINVRNPNAIRPWQHVLEPLSGYLTLAANMKMEPQKLATAFNFGPKIKDVRNVEELVQHAIKTWGKGNYIIENQTNAPHEAGTLKLNIKKAKKELHWKPKWNSDKAIERTINWYKNSAEKKADIYSLCVNDINDFVKDK
jgi:CDP-glucose 4,6-dehydratase